MLNYILYARKSSEGEDRQIASIPSQLDELHSLANDKGLLITQTFTEEQSAKAPGRPLFNEMLGLIHSGKANGILCWKLDRLARNPIDGGNINWMLQQGIIKHIQTYGREYFPTDNVLMINLEFGMANQFVLDLSVNTKRGIKQRVKDGWFPHQPPIGYLSNKHNLPDKKPIFIDKERFNIVKQLWELLLKEYSVLQISKIANELGLTTSKGTPLSRSKFYDLFKNPFYYGYFRWKGELHQGNHPPMITKKQFYKAQEILLDKSRPRSNSQTFKYRGLLSCGSCGYAVTAEKKTKTLKSGQKVTYTYYHCSQRLYGCKEPSIREESITEQIPSLLKSIQLSEDIHNYLIKQLAKEEVIYKQEQQEKQTSLKESLKQNKLNNDKLLNLRLQGELTPEEYQLKKKQLNQEKTHLDKQVDKVKNNKSSWIKEVEKLLVFAKDAYKDFTKGRTTNKKNITLKLANYLLLDNKNLRFKNNSIFICFMNSTKSNKCWVAIKAKLINEMY